MLYRAFDGGEAKGINRISEPGVVDTTYGMIIMPVEH